MTLLVSSSESTDNSRLTDFYDPLPSGGKKATVSQEFVLAAIVVGLVLAVSLASVALSLAPTISRLVHLLGN
jgi:hypothetical protein